VTQFIRAGDLNRLVSLQKRSTKQDAFGGVTECWDEIKKVYAKIEGLAGRELEIAQSTFTDVTHKITVHYDPVFEDPKTVAAYRMQYRARIFDLRVSMIVDEADTIVEIMASEGLTRG